MYLKKAYYNNYIDKYLLRLLKFFLYFYINKYIIKQNKFLNLLL